MLSAIGDMIERIQISSSISNWREKLLKRTGLREYSFPRDIFKPTLFFGAYHIFDWLRVFLHFGNKTIFFCGRDILALKKSWVGRYLIKGGWFNARHICENEIEHEALKKLGIESEIHPMIFDDPNKIEISYKHSDKPRVWVCTHPKKSIKEYGVDTILKIARELEDMEFHIYGIDEADYVLYYMELAPDCGKNLLMGYRQSPNVFFHGLIPNEQFNEEIKNYQCGVRLNKFDGFSEVVAKNLLLGGYPITMHIQYPEIDYATDEGHLTELLKKLKDMKKPNYESREYWFNKFENSLREVLK